MADRPTAPARTYTKDDIKRFRTNLREEVDGTALYLLLAEAENDPHLRMLYEQLAETEKRHTELWQRKLIEAGAKVPDFRPSFRVKALGWIARHFGNALVTPLVAQMERDATSMYDSQIEAIEHRLPADERSHARIFQEISEHHGKGRPFDVDIARIEGRHRASAGNTLRAAVLGANDGLVSNLSLVMGVAGASPGRNVVLLGGLAGLLAGAFSMALGEWVSVQSSRESFERQLAVERDELEEIPEEEEAELALIYQAKGLTEDEARTTARRIMSDPTTALATLAREELGMTADEAGNPWTAAITSFVLFALGAILPVLPWFFIGGVWAVALSAIAAGFGLFMTGAITTLFTGRSLLFSGARMLVMGLVAAAITFGIGRAIGVSTGV
ncbi:demethoxyubiquinone hydroxylase family protein [bacterium]|nr:demethoxyubiquinone hydroxylase family protein [bacterium]